MPYRGLDHAGPACYRHDAAAATETCARCLQAICDICVGFENTRPHCPPCAQKVRRRRTIGRGLTAALGLLIIVGAAGGVGFLATRDRPYDYGIHSGEVRLLEERLSAEPCDRPNTLKLTETMLRAGNYRGTLKKVQAFGQRCGEWPRLLWGSYTAHMQLSEHAGAVAVASRLIEAAPNDKDFWWWRAQAYEQMGELEKAAANYRKSLEVEPRLTGIPFNLANVLERLGRPCEAIPPINDFLRYHPDVTNRAAIDARLDRLMLVCGKGVQK